MANRFDFFLVVATYVFVLTPNATPNVILPLRLVRLSHVSSKILMMGDQLRARTIFRSRTVDNYQ